MEEEIKKEIVFQLLHMVGVHGGKFIWVRTFVTDKLPVCFTRIAGADVHSF